MRAPVSTAAALRAGFERRRAGKKLDMEEPERSEAGPEQDPPSEGGPTAPQDVDNPSERTSPPGNPEPDPERVHDAEEDQDRTIPG